jgi:putative flavoprotein involved in K+ transport
MKLYGPLAGIEGGQARFTPELKRNLDSADAVYRSINRTIDAFIEKNGIEAPTEPEYVAPWEPDGEIVELDASTRIRAVIWCIGFAADLGWVKAPVFDDSHYPTHDRGITAVPGLYFIGLPWLYTWGSGRFSGVGRDAQHIVGRMREIHAAKPVRAGAAAAASP